VRGFIFLLISGIILAGCAATQVCVGPADSSARVKELRCEYHVNPVGIDVVRPRLSWVTQARGRGWRQGAYRILAASSREKLNKDKGDLWDTGKVGSEQSIHIVYGGKSLKSRMRYFWKVRVWDRQGTVSKWSEPAYAEMGLLRREDWRGEWISGPKVYDWEQRTRRHFSKTIQWTDRDAQVEPSPFFRRGFSLDKKVSKARVYICGPGYYELYLNGRKVGDHVLDPAFTRYDRRVLYVTYDVTEGLLQGDNALGVVLGNGWYNMHTFATWNFDKAPWRDRPAVICQLEVDFEDGTSKRIVSDSSWKAGRGPIIFEGIRNGEVYDARREMPGWNKCGFDDSAWADAVVVRGPEGRLRAQMLPAIKVMKTIRPVKVTEPKPGVFVFDIGQNIAGWARLSVSGPAGTQVKLRYGERLYADGTLDTENISMFTYQWEFQTDTYILNGQGRQFWEPRFVYHGFRYVELTGFPGRPTADNLLAKVVHTSFERAGSFECSNRLLNRIQQATLWSYVSNFHGYPTDCPHREKNGWTGDAHLAAEAGLYDFDAAAAYTKWMDDFADEQCPDGELPGIIPTPGWGYGRWNSAAWSSAYFLIPWYVYEYCGDERILTGHYEGLQAYVELLRSRAQGHIVNASLRSTSYYYVDVKILAEAARLLGDSKEAGRYARLAADIRRAFNKTFYRGDGVYGDGSQRSLSAALYQGLVPKQERMRVADNLNADIEKRLWHIDASPVGTKHIFNALTQNGRAETAYRIATQTSPPSYGDWIERGATTLWEDWAGKSSHNHIFYGDISAWFYKALAGINPDPAGAGFKRIIIRPNIVGDLQWVRAEHDCMYGRIESAWRRDGDGLVMELLIPANTTATVYVPTSDAQGIIESGARAKKADGVKLLRQVGETAVFEVGSGRYTFESPI